MRNRLNWGVIGSGAIAADFTRALWLSERCRVVHVVGSSLDKARAFAKRYGVPGCSQQLAELLADEKVDAVYIATPHPLHEEQALACIAAGLPVLCEKPLAMSAAGAQRVLDAAAANGVFVLEGFMYRCHPLVGTLVERIRNGAIGKVRHIRADFGFHVPRDPESRLFNPKLGGGSILDVGGYPVSLARLIAGVAVGASSAEPLVLTACGTIGPTGADEYATALLTFPGEITAQVTSAISHDVGTTCVIYGDAGKIVLPDPWIPGGQRQGLDQSLTIHPNRGEPELVNVSAPRPIYAMEAELVADTLPGLEAPWPAMSWSESLANLRVMDAWRQAL
jgi:predicted dehydrogenase